MSSQQCVEYLRSREIGISDWLASDLSMAMQTLANSLDMVEVF